MNVSVSVKKMRKIDFIFGIHKDEAEEGREGRASGGGRGGGRGGVCRRLTDTSIPASVGRGTPANAPWLTHHSHLGKQTSPSHQKIIIKKEEAGKEIRLTAQRLNRGKGFTNQQK